MTFGQKLKEIRKRFGLSQEQLAEIMNVSRQAITKWENDNGLPDISNLQELSKVFGVTIDYLLDNDNQLPALKMKKKLDKAKYKNRLNMNLQVLKDYFPKPYEIYVLSRFKKFNVLESAIDTFSEIYPLSLADSFSDLSSYYLIKKEGLKFLVNIKNYMLEVIELPFDINEKKFVYGKNIFINTARLDLEKVK
ncbi:MAG: helix-turn-helix transcriptional regulator [Mollicutes bacterium]|nr:helix-turn-helix transcriptional regulator [Mollicutes bacterium]